MLSPCSCSENAEAGLKLALGLKTRDAVAGVEIEFREVPYFLVARSHGQWKPEVSGDINLIHIEHVNDRGVVVNADTAANNPARHTLIPWTNIISLSITRAASGAGGS